MSLPFAVRVVGIFVVGYLLIVGLLAMGPIGWVVFVPMLGIGAAQVYRNRTQRGEDGSETPDYCPSCGSAIEFEALETEGDDGRAPTVRYCPDCGASIRSASEGDRSDESPASGRVAGTTNCPDCGAPNDADRSTCEYCDATL